MTNAGIPLGGQISYDEATKRLKEFDVLIVPGGNVMKLIKEDEQPLDIIRAYAELQKSDPTRERTLLGVDTAALLMAKAGILQGLAATTHPDFYIKMEHLCQEASNTDTQERTDVMEERYVVNHGRFEIGEDEEENPYVFRKGRRTSNARKGSMLRKMSNARRESIIKRANMKLGGLRVITTSGPASGLDATLYLVSALVSHESAQEASRLMQYDWVKGVVVDAIDV
jgi:putative intracellular protease/amidase